MQKLAERQNIIIYVFVLCGLILVFKSAQLQLFSYEYRDQAERTTLDKKIKYPARGMMYDRNGKILVANNPIYDIEVTYNNVDPQMDTLLFCELLNITKEEFTQRLEKNWSDAKYSRAIPFVFMSKISPQEFARFQERLYEFPGFEPIARNIRTYPHQSAAHVLGYLSEVTNEDIENGEGKYQSGDLIGEVGLEKKYEEVLRGIKGIEYLLKDNYGREVGSFEGARLDSSAVSGEDIILSLDLDLQAYAEKLMVNKRGAIMALEPSSGEILAMVSSPSYNPNLLSFSRARDQAYRQLVFDTEDRPMINRVVSAMYPPGSIFKPIFSLIALQHGLITPDRGMRCNGVYRPTGQKCHAHTTPYNVEVAIQHSCNIYYYSLLQEFVDQYGYKEPGKGLDTLMSYLKNFGLGSRLGVDFPTENTGHLPSSEEYDEMHRITAPNGWRSSYITSLGIGQGEFQFTTVQMANIAAIIANRGYYVKPHFIKAFTSGNRDVPYEFRRKNSVGIEKKHFVPVIEGMHRAVLAGTSTTANIKDIEVCGKTGTSQNPAGEDHSVFICFAPKDNPKIAIATFVENAGWGATYAGTISGLMIEKYLKGEIDPQRKWMEERMIDAYMLNKEKL